MVAIGVRAACLSLIMNLLGMQTMQRITLKAQPTHQASSSRILFLEIAHIVLKVRILIAIFIFPIHLLICQCPATGACDLTPIGYIIFEYKINNRNKSMT